MLMRFGGKFITILQGRKSGSSSRSPSLLDRLMRIYQSRDFWQTDAREIYCFERANLSLAERVRNTGAKSIKLAAVK